MPPRITQAILPIAGLGTRFLPWTKSLPKEMLPIGNRPMIALLVDECLEVGITDICFVLARGKEVIPQYFQRDPALETELKRRGKLSLISELKKYENVRFHVVYQEEPLGDGHAIFQAKDWLMSDEVAILFGDDLFTGAENGLGQLIKGYELCNEHEAAVIAVENIPRADTNRYGIVDVADAHPKNPRLRKVRGLVEKPEPAKAPSTLGIVGHYLIPRSTFLALAQSTSHTTDGEIRLIDALISQLNAIPIYSYQCAGQRIDTGTPEGYREAVKVLS